MARLPSFDDQFDEHFKHIHKMQNRMLWMAPVILILNVVLGLGGFAAAVFIVLALLRYFGVV
jgi:hypothetical protein